MLTLAILQFGSNLVDCLSFFSFLGKNFIFALFNSNLHGENTSPVLNAAINY
jgi:hypothetical protein